MSKRPILDNKREEGVAFRLTKSKGGRHARLSTPFFARPMSVWGSRGGERPLPNGCRIFDVWEGEKKEKGVIKGRMFH